MAGELPAYYIVSINFLSKLGWVPYGYGDVVDPALDTQYYFSTEYACFPVDISDSEYYNINNVIPVFKGEYHAKNNEQGPGYNTPGHKR